MTEARGHHFISQCYLKRFTNDGSKESRLWVLQLEEGRSFTTTPARVGKVRDFNAIEGLPKDALENRLAGFEATANLALDRLEEHRNMRDQETWITVANLMALFAVRNPRMRETLRDFQERTSRVILDMVLSSRERWEATKASAVAGGYIDPATDVTYEQLKDFMQRGEYTVEVSNASHIGTEFHVLDPVLRTLLSRRWSLAVAAPGSGGFITSDTPVCLFRDDGQEPSMSVPLGHGLKQTTVLFPLSRNLAALGSYEHGGVTGVLQRDQVASLNSAVLIHADQQIYAASGNAPVISNGAIISIDEVRRGT